MPGDTGALSPVEAAQATLETGEHHLSEPILLAFIKNIYGALLLSAGSLLSIVLGAGFAGFTESNPGLQRLVQGFAFPIGLILVYQVGAELYTGYPMWYAMTALARKGRPVQYLRSMIFTWTGNLVGALIFSSLMTIVTQSLDQEPWRSGIVNMVNEDIVELPWHVIFIRAIGCGWLVTVAMFLGTQNQDGISKALGLHLPFLVSTAARFPHTVEYMYLASAGMMLGADLSIGGYIWRALIPITLGNTIGGSLFTGGYLYWVNIQYEAGSKGRPRDQMHRENGTAYHDED